MIQNYYPAVKLEIHIEDATDPNSNGNNLMVDVPIIPVNQVKELNIVFNYTSMIPGII